MTDFDDPNGDFDEYDEYDDDGGENDGGPGGPKKAVIAGIASVVLLGLVIGGLLLFGKDEKKPAAKTTTTSTTTTTTTTTTVAPVLPLAPLTGVPTDTARFEVLKRPAFAVKIDNHPDVSVSDGLDKADIVFEEKVEGITRFVAVFHSNDVDEVGPVRSARTSDPGIIASLNKPLFGWSGGNPTVIKTVTSANVINMHVDSGLISSGDYYRRDSARAPHNQFLKLMQVWAKAPADAVAPPQQFEYRAEGEKSHSAAVPSVGFSAKLLGTDVAYTWDANTKTWLRFSYGKRKKVTSGAQVAPVNVVALEINYKTSPADPKSPEAVLEGSGKAIVYVDGTKVEGTWERPLPTSPIVLKGPDGLPIKLSPGQTFVELGQAGDYSELTAESAFLLTSLPQ